MRTHTESGEHDDSRDDTARFGKNFDDIFGKPWYEVEEPKESTCTK